MSEDTQTLWHQLLRESSKVKRIPQASCVVIGDVGIGKSKLVDSICSSNNKHVNVSNDNIKTEIVSYNYLDFEEYESDTAARIHLWTIGLQTFDKAFEVLVNPKKTERLAIIIALDLTKDDVVDTLTYWLRKSKTYSQIFHSELTKDTSDQLKSFQAYYVQNIKSSKGTALQQPDDTSINNDNNNDFGLPIIVVGCKADSLKLDDVASSRKAKETQSQLRAICLQANSALIYTSAIKDVNCQKLGKYIMHRLYHDIIPFNDLCIEDGIDNIFIPTGFDTKDLISIATGVSVTNLQAVDLNKVISSDEDNQRKIASLFSKNLEIVPSNQIVEIESEEEWISGLQNFINQVTAGGAANTSTSTATSTSSAADTNKNTTSKRTSVRAPVALEEKQDVDDFFKSLLKK